MEIFNTELIKPLKGVLSARIFENQFVEIPKTLFYDISIELDPFTVNGETFETGIYLNFIKLKVKTVKELANKSFDFPVNPDEGYIDGSVYISNVHNPVDATRVSFGNIIDGEIEVEINYSIAFEFEATGFADAHDLRLRTLLKLS